jgi:hypothetical protein
LTKKRDYSLITPCCHKSNRDGKFVNYKGLSKQYGFCHSCGKALVPSTFYKDEFGNLYKWNSNTNKFERNDILGFEYKNTVDYTSSMETGDNNYDNSITNRSIEKPTIKKSRTIDFSIVEASMKRTNVNSLSKYLYDNFDSQKVKNVLQDYYLGTSTRGFAIFWFINKQGKVQKSKEVLYKLNGKRTNYFKVPYKNEDNYFFCLFGEHLITDLTKPLILVESEKTALICKIEFPEYNWLAYSGINGMTYNKMYALKGRQIVIIPDISQQAVDIAKKQMKKLQSLDIDFKILDLTYGKSDKELKALGYYNADIADILCQTML